MERESDVKVMADLIFDEMKSQNTHESRGTFAAWIRVEIPSITIVGIENMWKWVHRNG